MSSPSSPPAKTRAKSARIPRAIAAELPMTAQITGTSLTKRGTVALSRNPAVTSVVGHGTAKSGNRGYTRPKAKPEERIRKPIAHKHTTQDASGMQRDTELCTGSYGKPSKQNCLYDEEG